VPALHTDAYDTIQSNLTLARECIATALASLQLNNLSSLGEDRAAIPDLRDLSDYKATTTDEVRKFIKKLTSLVNQLGLALTKHTKVARRCYIQRVGAPIAAEYQRRQAEINRRQADINRERERLRQQTQELEELLRQNTRRRPQRAR
jgi:vacuolar-type H+-ATPase subunit I/STV1